MELSKDKRNAVVTYYRENKLWARAQKVEAIYVDTTICSRA